jgi:hypothetical protein
MLLLKEDSANLTEKKLKQSLVKNPPWIKYMTQIQDVMTLQIRVMN